jgi:transcriptional regulator with GAF, ATPase, and Fis domain/pSer/pThr/pTyr-binding forkhead associated (FHA) protein
MQSRLLIISGSPTGTVRPLIDGHLSIGRDESNQLGLSDTAVSRRHCTIQQVGEQYEVVDLDSRNGTFVNGIPVRRKIVEHGDTIRVGKSELVFLLHEGEEASTSQTRLSDPATASSTRTIRVEPPVHPTFGVEVGRMARDLAALFRIGNIINSIRDSELLQGELLRLIFEVIPAENGAVVLLTDLDEEPQSICTWSRQPGAEPLIDIQRELVHRAIWERSAVFTGSAAGSSEAQNVLCVPLVAVERTIGVIYLTSLPPAPPFREDHIHFLDSVSRIAAVTLENILALDALRSENRQLKAELNPDSKLVGESRQIRQVEEFISRVAQSDSTVLIRGESGTGKEVVARAIHQNGARPDRPFIAINCAAIPETLFESELFGYEKGAFTGAVGMRKGKLEAADDGTLFLDEIGELAPPMQAKLLRVLQQKEFERVGGTHSIPFKARVLAATNKNLEQAIKSGEFRQDLYYRLNVVSVLVPPLREHRDDIPLLALYFAAKYAEKSKRPFKGISREARRFLMGYSWPGNVRELENAIEHAIVLGLTEEILPEDLPSGLIEEQSAEPLGARYHDVLNEAKKELIRSSLGEAKGNFPEAARLLGIHPKYLHRLVRNLNLKSDLG